MNTTTKPRRSGAKIMAQLIVLLGSLVYIMLLAVINGTAGFLCAMGVTLSGGAAIAKALGEEISLSYGALIALETIAGTKLRDQSEFMPILTNKIESYLRQETN